VHEENSSLVFVLGTVGDIMSRGSDLIARERYGQAGPTSVESRQDNIPTLGSMEDVTRYSLQVTRTETGTGWVDARTA
jgi:hypothetical protein